MEEIKTDVLVKYRHADAGTVGWFQMDIEDARKLFPKVRRGLYWFCVVKPYTVWYWHSSGGWTENINMLKYC